MFVKNPNLGADPNLGDFTVYYLGIYLFQIPRFVVVIFLYNYPW